MAVALAYSGPQCPRCGVTLSGDSFATGTMVCSKCGLRFESAAFDPPQRKRQLVDAVADAGPIGANACANHARNAAVTSCQRCGLVICSLCNMDIGGGPLCPSCFDRVREEGTLQSATARYRDYASMARVAFFAGIFISPLAPIFGGLSLFYMRKALQQRRNEGRTATGVIVFGVLAGLELLGGLVFYGSLLVPLILRGVR
jgi:hypothetical protein